VLAKIIKESYDGVIGDMLDFVQRQENGIMIDDTWYDWDEIKRIFKKG